MNKNYDLNKVQEALFAGRGIGNNAEIYAILCERDIIPKSDMEYFNEGLTNLSYLNREEREKFGDTIETKFGIYILYPHLNHKKFLQSVKGLSGKLIGGHPGFGATQMAILNSCGVICGSEKSASKVFYKIYKIACRRAKTEADD